MKREREILLTLETIDGDEENSGEGREENAAVEASSVTAEEEDEDEEGDAGLSYLLKLILGYNTYGSFLFPLILSSSIFLNVCL